MKRLKILTVLTVIAVFVLSGVYAFASDVKARGGERMKMGGEGQRMLMHQSQNMVELRKLMREYRGAENETDKARVKDEIKTAVDGMVDKMADFSEKKIKEMETKLAEMKKNKSASVDERFNKLIERIDGDCENENGANKKERNQRMNEQKHQGGKGQGRAWNKEHAEKLKGALAKSPYGAEIEEFRSEMSGYAQELRANIAEYKASENDSEKEELKKDIKAAMDGMANLKISGFERALSVMKTKLSEFKKNRASIVEDRLEKLLQRLDGKGRGQGREDNGKSSGRGSRKEK